MREINNRLEEMRKEWRLSYNDLAHKLGGDLTGESLKRHFENDRGSSLTLAKLCKFFGLPFADPQEVFNGEVTRKLKIEMADRGWNTKDLLRKMWPTLKKDCFQKFLWRLYKFFDGESTDAYMIARMREVFGLPTVSSEDFLNEAEKMDLDDCLIDGNAQMNLAV